MAEMHSQDFTRNIRYINSEDTCRHASLSFSTIYGFTANYAKWLCLHHNNWIMQILKNKTMKYPLMNFEYHPQKVLHFVLKSDSQKIRPSVNILPIYYQWREKQIAFLKQHCIHLKKKKKKKHKKKKKY